MFSLYILGCSQAGKAQDFDSCMLWFESRRPSHFFLVELYPSVVKESVCNTVIAGSNPANSSKILLLWWNRQTRRFKEPMLSGVRVRVSLGAPITDIVQWQNNGLQNHQHRFDSCYLCHNFGQICKLVKQADCKSVTSDTLQVQILLCPPFLPISYGLIAQQVEQRTENSCCAGSIPAETTIFLYIAGQQQFGSSSGS